MVLQDKLVAWNEHDSGTRFEYPTIVDIDKDGSAEFFSPEEEMQIFGLRVIGGDDDSWAPARIFGTSTHTRSQY